MARVLFFEKPGCINNTRQKRWLEGSGHEVVARDLLAEPWEAARLRRFFGELPVAQWFNRSAPRITGGEVIPERMDEPAALVAMIADPLLIRRPLMEVEGECRVGFDIPAVRAWIGLAPGDEEQDLESCPQKHE